VPIRPVPAMTRLARYFVVGFILAAASQLLFWRQVGEGILLPLFVWSYSQQAVVAGVTGAKSATGQSVIWAGLYVAAAVVLWLLFERPSYERPSWRRPIAGWIIFQVVFAIAAWALYLAGVARME
jgi:hypothetical protein